MTTLLFSRKGLDMVMITISSFSKRGRGSSSKGEILWPATIPFFSRRRLDLVMIAISSFPKRGNGLTMATNSFSLPTHLGMGRDGHDNKPPHFLDKEGVIMVMVTLPLLEEEKGSPWS